MHNEYAHGHVHVFGPYPYRSEFWSTSPEQETERALQHARPGARLVAVVFDDELVDDLPVEPHDRRVTAVVTPSGGWQDLG